MADVLCLGEILVDWVSTTAGAELDTAMSFTKAPGGAPANVAVGLARQAVSSAFVGRVAGDAFGNWLRDMLKLEGINTDCTVVDPEANTRMAYVVTERNGDRKLAEFSRIACADARLSENDLQDELFEQATVMHFGSISQISDPARSATAAAIELSRKHALLISYDPNVRLALWPSPDMCKTIILNTLPKADIVKINIDELLFLTGSRELSAAEQLRQEHGIGLLIVTLDAARAHFTCAAGSQTVVGFSIDFVEATGAGDGFVSGVLAALLPHIKSSANRRRALTDLPPDILSSIIKRGNAVGALACTKTGAIPALPRSAEIEAFLNRAALATSCDSRSD